MVQNKVERTPQPFLVLTIHFLVAPKHKRVFFICSSDMFFSPGDIIAQSEVDIPAKGLRYDWSECMGRI